MGAAASKPTETKVFTPNTPVEYSNQLISKLDQSVETDYTRNQYKEKFLEEQVEKKLNDLNKESLTKFNKALFSAQIRENTEKDARLSSTLLDSKIENLSKILNDKESKFIKLNEKVLISKKEISACLTKNKDTPLNCWDEVKNFEKLVNELK